MKGDHKEIAKCFVTMKGQPLVTEAITTGLMDALDQHFEDVLNTSQVGTRFAIADDIIWQEALDKYERMLPNVVQTYMVSLSTTDAYDKMSPDVKTALLNCTAKMLVVMNVSTSKHTESYLTQFPFLTAGSYVRMQKNLETIGKSISEVTFFHVTIICEIAQTLSNRVCAI